MDEHLDLLIAVGILTALVGCALIVVIAAVQYPLIAAAVIAVLIICGVLHGLG